MSRKLISFFAMLTLPILLLFVLTTEVQLVNANRKFQSLPSSIDGGTLYFVSKNGDGTNGLTWNTAYTNVQAALTTVTNGDEIWVASGVYTPGISTLDSFVLPTDVAIYGGFATTETTRTQRDWEKNITVLSGDIDNNDGKDVNGVVTVTVNISGSNSFHVVTSNGVSANTILDGFTITAGQANGSNLLKRGAGMLNINGSVPTLANLTFIGNVAIDGGGLANDIGSSPTVTNVTFRNNSADYGGGMYNTNGSRPILNDVYFINNRAARFGGGLRNWNSSPTLTNVFFVGNLGGSGGGIANENRSIPIMTNIIFVGNTGDYGGGMYNNVSSRPTLTNVTFANNSANTGGAIANDNASSTVFNAIFWLNTVTNTAPVAYNASSSLTLNDSLVQGGCPTGTICNGTLLTNDPLFSHNPDAGDGDWSTFNDNDYGDLQLQQSSPAIDNGENGVVTALTDIAGNVRIQNGIVDLGAYEFNVPKMLSVFTDGNGEGGVSSEPLGIACVTDTAGDCQEVITHGASITLTATANTDSIFTGWSGDECIGNSSCVVTMDQAKSVTATFTINRWHVFLPMILTPELSPFPIKIGDSISPEPAKQGEIFYSNTISIPKNIPNTGRFFLSSQANQISPITVDDRFAISLNGTELFTYDFSPSCEPVQSAIVEVPRNVVTQITNQSVKFIYRDICGEWVAASTMWLIWVP